MCRRRGFFLFSISVLALTPLILYLALVQHPLSTSDGSHIAVEDIINTKTGAATSPPNINQSPQAQSDIALPVLIITYKRPKYLQRCLDSLFKHWPAAKTNMPSSPLIISQDGNHGPTVDLIKSIKKKHPLEHIQRLDRKLNVPGLKKWNRGYHQLAAHYKFALSHVFDTLKLSRIIILEEDLEIAPDFFEYFQALKNRLDTDDSVFCVSAWNDNGKAGYVRDPERLYRTDFFPGLGWMLTRELWQELRDTWPVAYWDDWLRKPEQTKGRHCIYPEVPRSFTFGAKGGASKGQFYNTFLKFIKLNDKFVPFTKMDLSYLQKDTYEKSLALQVSQAVPLKDINAVEGYTGKNHVKIIYNTPKDFSKLAMKFRIMYELKDKVLMRSSYNGVVSFYFKSKYVMLVPSSF